MESCPRPCCGLHDRYETLRVDSFDCPGKVVYRTMKKKRSDVVQKLSELVKEAG